MHADEPGGWINKVQLQIPARPGAIGLIDARPEDTQVHRLTLMVRSAAILRSSATNEHVNHLLHRYRSGERLQKAATETLSDCGVRAERIGECPRASEALPCEYLVPVGEDVDRVAYRMKSGAAAIANLHAVNAGA